MQRECPACHAWPFDWAKVTPFVPLKGVCACCCQRLPYVVTLVADDTIIATNYSRQTLHKTLRLAWELLGGIPQAEVCVRWQGKMVAYLHTDWRGNLEEVEVYSPVSSLVTPMNPNGPTFQGVFAA